MLDLITQTCESIIYNNCNLHPPRKKELSYHMLHTSHCVAIRNWAVMDIWMCLNLFILQTQGLTHVSHKTIQIYIQWKMWWWRWGHQPTIPSRSENGESSHEKCLMVSYILGYTSFKEWVGLKLKDTHLELNKKISHKDSNCGSV